MERGQVVCTLCRCGMNEERRRNTELSKFEWDMLQKWRRGKSKKNKTYEYQVRVGSGADVEAVKSKWMKKCIRANSRLKIDCVVRRNNIPERIIEVKNIASPGAIGQLLCYKYLYDKEHDVYVKMTLLCKFASADIYELCDDNDIEISEI